MDKKKRVFVAINLPTSWRQGLFQVQELLKKRVSSKSVKWVEKENFHLTLVFLGEVSQKGVELIQKSLREVKAPCFFLSLSNLGFFPNPKRPRVLWVGVEGEIGKLNCLYREIVLSLKKHEIDFEQKFYPHITIGRVRHGHNVNFELNKKIEQKLKLNKFFVQNFELKESRLTPKGAQYFTIERFPLKSKI